MSKVKLFPGDGLELTNRIPQIKAGESGSTLFNVTFRDAGAGAGTRGKSKPMAWLPTTCATLPLAFTMASKSCWSVAIRWKKRARRFSSRKLFSLKSAGANAGNGRYGNW